MMSPLRAIFLFVFFCLISSPLVAVEVTEINISDVAYLKESQRKLNLDEVMMAYSQAKFTEVDESVLNFGIGSSPVWIRLVVHNRAQAAVMQRLQIDNSWIDDIAVYFQYGGETVKKVIAGDILPYAQRAIDLRFYAFDYRFEPGLNVVFLRIKTPDPLLLPITLSNPADAYSAEISQAYSYGFVYGFIIALSLYNAILFLSLRHARYLYYAIYLLLFVVTNMAYSGHGFKWIWPESTVWQQWANPVLMLLYGFAGFRFATSFLQTARNFPKTHSVIVYSCIGFAVLEVLAILFGNQVAALNLSFGFIFLYTLAMLLLGVTAVYAGQTSAKYFVYASLSAMIGALLTALTVWGAIPYSELTYRAVEVGMLIDSVLLAMALADELRLSQEEKVKAKQLANNDLLTRLNNRRGFYEMVKPLWASTRRYNRDASMILLDIDFFKSVNDTHGHMQGDKVLVAIAGYLMQAAREGDILARWGGEEFILYLPETSLIKAVGIAERLRQSLEELDIALDKTSLHVTASFGVVCRGSEETVFDDLISRADKLLYKAKAGGRNRVCEEAETDALQQPERLPG